MSENFWRGIYNDTDDDDGIPLAQLVRMESVYGQKITDLVNMESEVKGKLEETDRNKPASELLKDRECDEEASLWIYQVLK